MASNLIAMVQKMICPANSQHLQDSKGIITTLGRDGSDLTATVIGAAVKASEVQIWKDVSGVQTTDPRVISSAKPATLQNVVHISTFSVFQHFLLML